MSTTYTGAWKRSATSYVAADGTRVPVHTVDPAHGIRDLAPDARQTGDAPSAALLTDDMAGLVGDLGNYPGADWFGAQMLGGSYDSTDYASHERDDTNRGAAAERYRGEPVLQFADESYAGTWNAGDIAPGVQLVNPVALQRGRNGQAVNDPSPAEMIGEFWFAIQRRMLLRNLRQHERRVVQLPVADTLEPAPAVPGSHGSAVPFMPTIVRRRNIVPTTRRVPPAFSEDGSRDEGYGAETLPAADVWTL